MRAAATVISCAALACAAAGQPTHLRGPTEVPPAAASFEAGAACPTRYVVSEADLSVDGRGDQIAKEHGITTTDIVNANPDVNFNNVAAGTILTLPCKGAAPAPKKQKPKAAAAVDAPGGATGRYVPGGAHGVH